jgi:Fe2+ or Zn2+ uptake regulation protein
MSTDLPAVRRSTRQRRLVYEAVMGTDTHPTAEWVYDQVRRVSPRISLGTVYRNLQVLVSEGRLRSFARGGRTCYDGDLTPHDHFSCERCGLLMDIPRSTEALPAERRLRATGHAVTGRTLEFFGLCRECRRSIPTGGGLESCPSSPTPRPTRT